MSGGMFVAWGFVVAGLIGLLIVIWREYTKERKR